LSRIVGRGAAIVKLQPRTGHVKSLAPISACARLIGFQYTDQTRLPLDGLVTRWPPHNGHFAEPSSNHNSRSLLPVNGFRSPGMIQFS